MLVRIILLTAMLGCLAIEFNSCGSSSDSVFGPRGLERPEKSQLPQLPAGADETRLATTFSGVSAPGNPAFDSANATPDGGNLLLESGEELFNLTAWAIYQIPESPGDPIDMLSVTAQYLDPDPVVQRPGEGYWIAYADYATESWVFSGPHKSLQARVTIPPAADAVSPGGFHYLLALVCQSNQALVQNVAIGGYDGIGYESYALGRPSGQSVGYKCDIQLDSTDVPQIAYLARPYLTKEDGAYLRVARKAGDHWEAQAVVTGFEPKWFSFALGDDGRRALLIADSGTNDLWLYYDNNSGEFSDIQLISNSFPTDIKGSVTFVNSADVSSLPLDMAVVVYTSLLQAISRTYDGVVLGPMTPVFPLPAQQPDRIKVSTTLDKLAMVGIPDDSGGKRLHIGTYSGGVWNWGAIPPWNSLADFALEAYDAVARESPTGDIVACYLSNEGETVTMGRYDGVSWLSGDQDILAWNSNENINIDAFGSGRTVILMRYGPSKPLLRWGLAGSGESFGQQYLATDSYAAVSGSLEVDSANNVHIAAFSGLKGQLDYYVRDPSNAVTMDTADTGGMILGGSQYFVQPVYTGNSLHLFYTDVAHPGVLHAVNTGGIWSVENEVIESRGFPYYVVGAGYLDNLDLLYVCYLDYLDLRFYVLTVIPGGDDWERQPAGMTFGEYAVIADDESNIAILGATMSPLTDTRITFNLVNPDGTPPTEEVVTLDTDLFDLHSALAYNPFDSSWGYASTFDANAEVVYFKRAGPDDWTGPFTVTKLTNPGANAYAQGLSYLEQDGTPRVVVRQQAAGDPEIKTVVYTASPSSTDFSYLAKIMGIQDTTDEMPYAVSVPGPGGEPVVAILHKLIADSTYNIDLFVSDGAASWALHETWDSPLINFYPRLAIASDGQPAIAGIENNDASALLGTVVAFYPW